MDAAHIPPYQHTISDPEPLLADPSLHNLGVAHEAPNTLVSEHCYTNEFKELREFNHEVEMPAPPKSLTANLLDASDRTQHIFRDLHEYPDSYPDFTSAYCWWCAHSFQNRPVGIPMRRDDVRGTYHAFGNFCSASCALAYANARKIDAVLLRQMHSEVETITPLEAAPPQSMLTIFGGTLSIEEFRQKGQRGTKWRTYKYPLMPWVVLREEVIKDNRLLPCRKIQPRSLAPPRQTKLRTIMSRTSTH